MKKTLRILATVTIAMAFITLFNSLFLINTNLIKELDVNIKVGNTIGLNADPNLNFGILPPGASSTKKLIIENTENKEVKITLIAEGPIKDLINFQENNFFLKPKESKEIEVVATAPLNSNNGEFTGTVKIYTSNK